MPCTYGSFHEDRLPDTISRGMVGGPEFSTDITTLRSGAEERNVRWSRARRSYDVQYGIRDGADVHLIREFHIARMGRAHAFRVRDWGDFSTQPGSCDVSAFDDTLGTISDLAGPSIPISGPSIPIYRTYQSGGRIVRRRIYKPRPCGFRVAVDGVEMLSGWSLDPARGIVEFERVLSGSCITWGGLYDTPVRFDSDRLDASMILVNLGEYPSVPLIEVLDERDIWPETEDDAIRAHLGSSDAALAEISAEVAGFGTFVEGLFA